jgi:hypothetical protein
MRIVAGVAPAAPDDPDNNDDDEVLDPAVDAARRSPPDLHDAGAADDVDGRSPRGAVARGTARGPSLRDAGTGWLPFPRPVRLRTEVSGSGTKYAPGCVRSCR